MLDAPKIRYFVGIAGGTGSGKTTFAKRLLERLPEGCAAVIEHDSYHRHRPELSEAQRDAVNFDHPESLDNALLAEHLDALRDGGAIDVPIYDFRSHLRSGDTIRCPQHPIVIVEGILMFVDPALRRRMDLKVFVDTDADTRLLRRIGRDIESCGRTFQQVRDQYVDTVRPMHDGFVEPSRAHADLVIPGAGDTTVVVDLLVAKLRDVIGVNPVTDRRLL